MQIPYQNIRNDISIAYIKLKIKVDSFQTSNIIK